MKVKVKKHRPYFEEVVVITSSLPFILYSEHDAPEIVMFLVASTTLKSNLVCASATPTDANMISTNSVIRICVESVV